MPSLRQRIYIANTLILLRLGLFFIMSETQAVLTDMIYINNLISLFPLFYKVRNNTATLYGYDIPQYSNTAIHLFL